MKTDLQGCFKNTVTDFILSEAQAGSVFIPEALGSLSEVHAKGDNSHALSYTASVPSPQNKAAS